MAENDVKLRSSMGLAAKDGLESAPKAHSLLDAGGAAVLMIVLGLFVAPTYLFAHLGFAAGTPPLFEIRMLLLMVLLSLVLPLLQINLQIRSFGGTAIRSNRVGFPNDEGAGGRVARAHRNLIESLVPFAAAVLSAQAFGVTTRWTVAASVLYVAARLVHAASYTFGVTVIRSAAFYAGLIATVMIVTQLPLLAFAG